MRLLLPFLFLFQVARAQTAVCTVAIEVQDSIGAATYDLIQRASEKAVTESAFHFC